ncbi:hypothetical protein A2U01_0108692, partial [Trifolium medium]|nr:hypothetical protein [Trifolium medium]
PVVVAGRAQAKESDGLPKFRRSSDRKRQKPHRFRKSLASAREKATDTLLARWATKPCS